MNRFILTLLLAGGIYTAMRNAEVPTLDAGLQGQAFVHDGDTLTLAGIKIWLFGVDAPELDQTCKLPDGSDWDCGRWSRDQLRSILSAQELHCVKQAYDKYGRMVARCYLDGQDLAEMLVRDGIVFSYASFSREYISVEKTAAVAGRGLWAAKVIPPDEFRR